MGPNTSIPTESLGEVSCTGSQGINLVQGIRCCRYRRVWLSRNSLNCPCLTKGRWAGNDILLEKVLGPWYEK